MRKDYSNTPGRVPRENKANCQTEYRIQETEDSADRRQKTEATNQNQPEWAQRKGRPQRTGRPGPCKIKVILIAQAEIHASARDYSVSVMSCIEAYCHIRLQRSIGSQIPLPRHNMRATRLFRNSLLRPHRHNTAWDRESDRAWGSNLRPLARHCTVSNIRQHTTSLPNLPVQPTSWDRWQNRRSSGSRPYLLPGSLLPLRRYRTRQARYSRSRQAKPSQPTGQLQHQQR
jgi:hypothetical protein